VSDQAEQIRSNIEKFQRFLDQDPTNINLVTQLVDLQYQIGDFDKARELLVKTLASGPNEPGLMFRLSNVALAQGEVDEAVEILKGLQAQGIDNATIQYNLAYAYMYKSLFSEAREILERLTQTQQENVAGVSMLLGRCYHHLGELEKAVELGKEYIPSHQNDQEAIGVFSLAAYDAGDESVARQWAQNAIKLNNDNLEARIVLGSIALSGNDFNSAEENFQIALAKYPTNGRAWSGQGMADLLKLDMGRALESLENAVKYMPNHIGTWHTLAWCQLLRDDIAGAKESFDKAMELDRNFGETHGGVAVVAYLQGDKETAKIETRKSIMLNPYSFAGRFAESLLTNDIDPDKAQQMINDILSSQIGNKGETLTTILTDFMKTNMGSRGKPVH